MEEGRNRGIRHIESKGIGPEEGRGTEGINRGIRQWTNCSWVGLGNPTDDEELHIGPEEGRGIGPATKSSALDWKRAELCIGLKEGRGIESTMKSSALDQSRVELCIGLEEGRGIGLAMKSYALDWKMAETSKGRGMGLEGARGIEGRNRGIGHWNNCSSVGLQQSYRRWV